MDGPSTVGGSAPPSMYGSYVDSLSKQSKIILIVMGFFSLLAPLLVWYKMKLPPIAIASVMIFAMLETVLLVYTSNCMIKGKCNTYVWFMVAIVIANTIISTASILQHDTSALSGVRVANKMSKSKK